MGSQSRLIQCGDVLLEKGHGIVGVISADPAIQGWAKEKGLTLIQPDADWVNILCHEPFDLFLSIDNLFKVPHEVLHLAQKFSVNFHDGPLPRYAGVNVTNWAVMNQEVTHGVTWHVMSDRIDSGDILKQVVFPISSNETTLTLNAKCYEKSVESFAELLDELVEERVTPIRQDLTKRTFYGRWKRPVGNCTLDWRCSAKALDALFRGLDRGFYENPLGMPKLYLDGRVVLVNEIEVLESDATAAPGTILFADDEKLRVATETCPVELRGFFSCQGLSLAPSGFLSAAGLAIGDHLPSLEQHQLDSITTIHSELCKHESFWLEQLRGNEPIELPYRKHPVSKSESPPYLEMRFSVPDRVLHSTDMYKNLGDSLLAAVLLYFSRLANKPDFVIDYQDAVLRQKISGAEAFFSSQVPLHVKVDPQTQFREFRNQVAAQVESIRIHGTYARDLPFRDPRLREALSQQVAGFAPLAIERVENLTGQKPNTRAKLIVVIPDDGKECVWQYDAELFDHTAIDRMQRQFAVLLTGIADGPKQPVSELPLLLERERQQLLTEWNNTKADYPQDICLHQRIEAQVERTPDNVAVECAGTYLSYRELNERANRLAHHLIGLGVGPESLVGVALERSVEMVVSLLATMKSGAGYLPLDPKLPKARLAHMLADATPAVVLSTCELQARLPQTDALVCLDDPQIQAVLKQLPNHNPNDRERTTALLPQHTAYVIFTSGSTGMPKGVLIRHRELTCYLSWASRLYDVSSGVGAPVNTPLAFDATVTSFYLPLIAGQRIFLLPEDTQIEALADLLASGTELTLVKLTPAHLEVLVDLLGAKISAVRARVFVVGGEALKGSLATFWKRQVPLLRIVNEYGPTETTVGCCVYELPSDGNFPNSVPIGRPVPNTQLYILDQHLQPVPAGVPGELYIGGDQVGAGYLKRPELTAEKFVPDPFQTSTPARLYKTGDLCRWAPDGNIEYLGRMDFQVKIRGFRIELGEIESALKAQPTIAQAAVIASEDRRGSKRLVAYLVGTAGTSPNITEMRRCLVEQLPDYMVPAAFVVLDALPLTANGKLDRRALPLPKSDSLCTQNPSHPPVNDTEQKIAEIWQSTLGITTLGRDDNFFDLGGDSLTLIKVRSELQRIFERKPTMVDLFHCPTIRTLARYFTVGAEEATTAPQSPQRIALQQHALHSRQVRQRIRSEKEIQ
ncbi:MAG: amino acid adenylation domain-containing protein [Candidatus Acidiferrum sp.]